jgi:hypothetical protein
MKLLKKKYGISSYLLFSVDNVQDVYSRIFTFRNVGVISLM